MAELVRAQAREAVAQALIKHSEGMQAAERQSVRQLKQAEEARRSMTEQLAAAAAEAALVTALQNRQWSRGRARRVGRRELRGADRELTARG